MSKRNNVAYIKPSDPKFLKQIKEQIGYKEGPTLETKRQKLEAGSFSSGSESDDDEKPQVVVVKKGDLTSEQADLEKKRIEKEEGEKPADLEKRVIFKSNRPSETKPKGKKPQSKSTLSFANDDEEAEEE